MDQRIVGRTVCRVEGEVDRGRRRFLAGGGHFSSGETKVGTESPACSIRRAMALASSSDRPSRFLPATVRMSRRRTSCSAQKEIIFVQGRADFVADDGERRRGRDMRRAYYGRAFG